ncbi:MAG: L-glutamate gamma-semialdehyde dehydrogenase [Deltaproteobacteria bacterium]|nr:L-glutamate gamma-semialdehyde dehydrogenase [Deltaproteobacteria bacterium]MBK8239201.1 L-glutamate gamma-semialdehyde dehydrogenase [Deltaproteobacteria bacterium]MBP7288659.1 L-glutamate gamma-semialdehyde dehydrogenase [Nannocystaceae bacterium]
MTSACFEVPKAVNEPVRDYAPGSRERERLQAELTRQLATPVEIAPRIDGRDVRTGRTAPITAPHAKRQVLGVFHQAGRDEVDAAIAAARRAKPGWAALPWEERAAIFLRAATLLRERYRDELNAATMLGQSKTAHQAEIDAACELIDFFTFNVEFYTRILAEQPISPAGVWNRVDYRPLDGFVFALTPFNFTSIAGNLPTAPALCGNTVVWKPASTAVRSGAVIMSLLEDAGLPPGVINFVPGPGAAVGDPVLDSTELGGVHFTGSTDTFQALWRRVGDRIASYPQYPRLVGETGGKDFVLVHPSADVDEVAVALLRGAFEYQGQKCSAASRAYVPRSLWPAVRQRLGDMLAEVGVGDVTDFRNFMGAVIDGRSHAKLAGAIDEAIGKRGPDGDIDEVLGGRHDDAEGWFIHPTVIVARNPKYRTMCEELFGPVLTIHVWDDAGDSRTRFGEVLALVDGTSPYALTGAVFAHDRDAVAQATAALREAAGNFYVNDKPTGAVVGQQPFGGARASGTNDKAGSMWNLIRWLSPRTIKETFAPPRSWRYPYMG